MDLSAVKVSPETLSQTIGSFSLPNGETFSPTYLQVLVVVVCVFLLLLTFAILRKRQHEEHIRSIMPAIAFGFTLALVIEAVLLIGGRTLFTEIIGWEDAPKPIANALDASRSHLVDVLGVTDTVPESQASDFSSAKEMMSHYEQMEEKEQERLQNLICQ